MRPEEPTSTDFLWQMEAIAKNFNPLSLAEAMDCLDSGRLPARAVCITFDDGYADNATLALPILQKFKIPATVFVASGYMNGGRMWNDTVIEAIRAFEGPLLDLSEFKMGTFHLSSESQRYETSLKLLQKVKYLSLDARAAVIEFLESVVRPLPHDLMLTNSQILELVGAGIEIGGHTKNHPIMATLTIDEALEELESNRADLESLISKPVEYFAYPNGKKGQDYYGEHSRLVERQGFRAAFSTDWGVSNENTNRFGLPRFTPWDRTVGRFVARLLLNQSKLV
jgi:peptidoglycan/xylan/chitin deacetylase (PgdA/CDA1 family)